jgi:hypothetical protein
VLDKEIAGARRKREIAYVGLLTLAAGHHVIQRFQGRSRLGLAKPA